MILNAPLVIAVVLIMAWMASGLDTQDIVGEWTPEGMKLAMQIPAPTGRPYVKQMVEHPYTRYGITEEA